MKYIITQLDLLMKHFHMELKAIFSDRGALLVLVGAVLIYPLIYSFGYYNEIMTDLKVGVVDLDHSEMSRKYSRMLDATQELEVINKPSSLAEAENLFMQNEIESVIVLPKDFQKNVLSNMPAHVAVYADASYFLKYRNAYMAASVVNSYFSGGASITKYMLEGKTFDQARVANDPLPVYRHVLYNPSSGYASYIMPAIILIIIQQTLLIGIGILGGSFSESKASPFLLPVYERKREIVPYLAGKTGAYLVISLINVAFGTILVNHWFNYPDKANVLEILMLLFPYVVAVCFLGIGLSTLFRHRESSIVFMVFLSPIALFLSGLSWPLSSVPSWLVALSKLMPSSTVVPAYLRLRTMGVGITGIRHEVIWLYIQAAIYAALTIIYFYMRINKKNVSKPNSVFQA